MGTEVSQPILYIADHWENHCGYTSAVLSGIRPDARHRSGYHPSVLDLRRFGVANSDYSNVRPDDKNFNIEYGAAVDISMSPADMKRCHDRVRRVWADKTDLRRKYVNAINTWAGFGDAVRLDFYADTAKYASPDHKWHNHGEVRRRYLLDMTAARAIVSALKGETKAAYLSSIGQGEDEDLKTDERQWLKDVRDVLCDPAKGFAIAPSKTKQPLAALLGHMAYPLLNDPGETGSGAYIAAWMRLVAEAAGISPAEMAQISAAAREGAASAADGIVAAVTAKLPDDLGGMTRAQVVGAVEEGVREAFAGGLAS